MTVLFVDGWFGPDPGDWQELWGRGLPSRRIVQDDWDTPGRVDWVERLDEEVAAEAEPPVLVGHSLGALAVAHWVAEGHRGTEGRGGAVRGALLVTPADVERNPDPAIRGFAPIPRTRFPFPAILAASRTDRWMTPERAAVFADAWGARLVDVGEVGHLTVAEGAGDWPRGRALLDELL